MTYATPELWMVEESENKEEK